jgi:acetyl-CoA carboxylase biotin carboxyl carrier protein
MNIKEIKALIKAVEQSNIDEIEIFEDGKKIRISKNIPGQIQTIPVHTNAAVSAQVAPAAPVPTNAPQAAQPTQPAAETKPAAGKNIVEVKAPMVGTFYRAPAPDAPPYVEVGDEVKVGQTLCIIEAMKLMNEIESEYNGKIVDILVENAEPVEFDQVLFLIEKY